MSNSYSSKLLEKAIGEFSTLPGVGRKTALRYALFILKQKKEVAQRFGNTIIELRENVKYCRLCHNLSDDDVCDICSSTSRDHSILCVVENVQDVAAIENTGTYRGLYHVLGGIISPMDGIGPSDIEIDSLVNRVAEGGIEEVIIALNPTMEGDTTGFYISRRMAAYNTKISTLARGVAVGDEIEYTDEITLGRSLINRVPLDNQI